MESNEYDGKVSSQVARSLLLFPGFEIHFRPPTIF